MTIKMSHDGAVSDSSTRVLSARRSLLVALSAVMVRVVVQFGALAIGHPFLRHGVNYQPGYGWATPFVQWDGGWNLRIASIGYRGLPSFAFWPGYPLIVRYLAPLWGEVVGAVLASWFFAVLALWGLLMTLRRRCRTSTALVVTLLFAWGPASIFLYAAYYHSLLAAATIWAMWSCLERRWALAVVAAFAAGLTAAPGVLVALAVGGFFWWVGERQSWRRVCAGAGMTILAASGGAGFFLWAWSTTGYVGTLTAAESVGWHRHFTWPLYNIFQAIGDATSPHRSAQMHPVYALNAVAAILSVAVALGGIWLVRQDRDWSLPVAMTLVNVFFLSSTTNPGGDSLGRFMLCSIATYVVLAGLVDHVSDSTRRRLLGGLLAVAVTSGVVFGDLFGFGYWFI